MKSHERKAIKRAVEYYFIWEPPVDIPRLAVKLAMLRAGRLYDDQTQEQAIEYAAKLIREGW